MELVLERLRREAAGLVLPPSRRAAERYAGVRPLPRHPSVEDLRALARCSCEIFGSAERAQAGGAIWGEGWRCGGCGEKRPVSAVGACASCGAEERRAIHDLDATVRTFTRALRPRGEWQPVGCVLEEGGRIVGYSFGAVTTPRRAAGALREKLGEYRADLEARGVDLPRVDLDAALPDGSPVLFMDELCIEPAARRGIVSLQALMAVFLAGAAELGARSLVGFTSKRAAPFRLTGPGGGEVSLDLGDLVVLRFEDFRPIAALLHHISPDELVALLAREPPADA